VLGTDADTVAEEVESTSEQRRLLDRLQILSKRERKVLELRYGLMNGLRKTQRDIAKKLGISRSYVSRIEKKAIQKLMKEMNN